MQHTHGNFSYLWPADGSCGAYYRVARTASSGVAHIGDVGSGPFSDRAGPDDYVCNCRIGGLFWARNVGIGEDIPTRSGFKQQNWPGLSNKVRIVPGGSDQEEQAEGSRAASCKGSRRAVGQI